MRAAQNTKSTRLLAFIPFALGVTALGLCAVYEAQRSDLLFSYFARFVQHHVDEVGFFALVAGVLGGLTGVVIIQFRGRNHIATIGTLSSVAAMLWSLLLPL